VKTLKTQTSRTSLLTRWTWLLASLPCAVALHVALHLNAPLIAGQFVPAYTPYSVEEAASRGRSVCENDISARTVGIDCEKALPDYMAAVQTGKAVATQGEVDYLSEKIQIAAGIIFCIVYGALAMFATRLFTEWRDSRPQRLVRHSSADTADPLVPLQRLKRMSAARSLRNAEEEYRTLESLHDKGLITDEMFEKGKRDLTAALGMNEIFSK
jgi:hypothetical protein